MISPRDCAAIVLAAGRSRRFGVENKLLVRLEGKALVGHAFELVVQFPFRQIIAVVEPGAVEALARASGLETVTVTPGRPQGASLVRGATRVDSAGTALVLLGDMPRISQGHVAALFDAAAPGEIVATRAVDYVGPPVILPVARLLALDPDQDRGARGLLEGARFVTTTADAAMDIDVPGDLERARERKTGRP